MKFKYPSFSFPYFYRISYKICIFSCFLLLHAIYAQNQNRLDTFKKEPSALIDRIRLQNLEKKIAEANQVQGTNPNFEEIIKGATEELQKYYEQFVTNKSILYERQNTNYDYRFYDKNTLRLLSQSLQVTKEKPFFQGQRPYLQRLHLVLARAYSHSKNFKRDNNKALQEYKNSLRYTVIEPFFSEIDTPSTNSIIQKKIPVTRYLPQYEWMQNTFCDSERLQEEENQGIIQAAQKFTNEYQKFLEAQKNYKKAQDKAAIVRFENAPENIELVEREEREQNEKEKVLNESMSILEKVRLNEYKDYVENYRVSSAKIVFEMAQIIKIIELENRITLAHMKRATLVQGANHESSINYENTEFVNEAYTIALELAHKINPFEVLYIKELSNEYRKAGATRNAIYYYGKYIHAIEKNANAEDELRNSYLRLAGLYIQEKNDIQASIAYENYLKLEKDVKLRGRALLALADLHFKKTGKYNRALELFQEWRSLVEKVEKERADDIFVNQKELLYEVLQKIARIYNLKLDKKNEKLSLEKNISIFSQLENELSLLEREVQSLLEQERVLKKELYQINDERKQKEYFLLKDKTLVNKKRERDIKASKLRSLNHPRTLERLALLYVSERSWSKVEELYKQILRIGSSEQITRTRKNLEGLEAKKKEGKVFIPLLAPDFDR